MIKKNSPMRRLRIAMMTIIGTLLPTVVVFIMLSVQQANLKQQQRDNWDKMTVTAHIGRWQLDIESGKLTWDETCFEIYGSDRQDWSPSYASFLAQLSDQDKDWVDQACLDAIRTGGYYRAVFRLGNGRYIRAYGSVFDHNGRRIFAGICIPARPEEYIGRPFFVISPPAEGEGVNN